MKTLVLSLLCTVFYCQIRSADFITIWDLGKTGSSPTSLSFNINFTAPVDYTWETIPAAQSGAGTISTTNVFISWLPSGAKIRLKLKSNNLRYFSVYPLSSDRNKLLFVEQWGDAPWTSMVQSFQYAENLQIISTDIPDLSHVQSMSRMFKGCTNLNSPTNINQWKVDSVWDMTGVFMDAASFNQPLDNWNTTNVYVMEEMFSGAISFNQPIDTWNTSLVKSMSRMFCNASSFNQPIGNWDTWNVEIMTGMFKNALSFNQPIDNWNTQNLVDMSEMFYGASSFNQPINSWNIGIVGFMNNLFMHAIAFNQPLNNWNTSSVMEMEGVFNGASSFNQPLNNWNTAQVQDFTAMFHRAESFNQNINTWNMSKARKLNAMFCDATAFNQPISNWNVSSVFDMESMFQGAKAFNQPLELWNTGKVLFLHKMFSGAEAFNQPIHTWNTTNVVNMDSMFQGAVVFNQPIGNWNTSGVKRMHAMFKNNPVFNQDISAWDTKSVEDFSEMFSGAVAFNQPIGTWNTEKAKYMNGMFENASNFNQPIGTWNTGRVEYFSSMFSGSVSFNQAIGTWHTASATQMQSMFQHASSFNQPLYAWNFSEVNSMDSMFSGAKAFNQFIGSWKLTDGVSMLGMLDSSGLDCSMFTSALIAWSKDSSYPKFINLGARGLRYGPNAASARNQLLENLKWTITGDTMQTLPCCIMNYQAQETTSCPPFVIAKDTMLSSGRYFVHLTNSNGCDSILRVDLEIQPLVNDIFYSKKILNAVEQDVSYQWVRCPDYSSLPGQTNRQFAPTRNGEYAVILTRGICSDTSQCIPVSELGLLESDFNIFPNPTSGILRIRPSDFLNENVRLVYDAVGHLIRWTYEDSIDLSDCNPGIYFFKCGTWVQKLVIE